MKIFVGLLLIASCTARKGDDSGDPTDADIDARAARDAEPDAGSDDAGSDTNTDAAQDAHVPVPSVVLAGTGDVCGDCELTADVIDTIAPDAVFTAGDNAYPEGSLEDFLDYYDPYWGRFNDIVHPAPGNHDYYTKGAAGYYEYFGEAAHGPPGYYSYDIGAWHVVVINSNCSPAGGCEAGSPQELWLRNDLAQSAARCTLAYWHHPLFSSGPHGNDETMRDIWRAFYEADADLIIGGHDHLYERFAPQDPDGNVDDLRGIRQFVVGTGGAESYSVREIKENSELRHSGTQGVLKLTLHEDSYEWEFVGVEGATFTDSGFGACH